MLTSQARSSTTKRRSQPKLKPFAIPHVLVGHLYSK
jgi:hypothetical protein